MSQPTPSFLGRTRKMKTGAVAAKSNQPASHATSAAANAELVTSAAAKSKGGEKGQASGKRTGAGGKGRKQGGDVAPLGVSPLGYLRQMATRPEAVDLLETMRPGCIDAAVDAMVTGAGRPGREGVADRSAIWKMMGLPWAMDGNAKAARDLGTALGAAYGEAVSRLEGHRRHKPVTVAEPMTLEGAADSHS